MADIQRTIDNLNEKGFIAKSFGTMDQAKQEILNLIDVDKSVGTGGTMTAKECGILSDLREKGCEVFSYMLDVPRDAAHRKEIMLNAMAADFFLTSSNAITEKGSLVNIDGNGNRVAAMSFGFSDVIVLAGSNKIVGNYNEAIKRIKTESCGKNARRLSRQTPCAKTDKCGNCKPSDGRMCNITTLIEYPMMNRNYYVFIVDGEWGY